MTIELSIIGCGKVGTSIGLALGNHAQIFHRKGFDRKVSTANLAYKKQAFDHLCDNIKDCVENADAVLLAIPVDEIIITLETIIPLLKTGATIIDSSITKINIKNYIEENLPVDLNFISLYPTINPAYIHEFDNSPDFAHPDLFQNSLIAITGSARTNKDSFKLGTDLIGYLGAEVLIADPYEVDGLLAATEILPKIISSAYIHAVMDEPGWKEGRKLTNSSFYTLTSIIANLNEREDLGKSAELNKENTVRTINNLILSLKSIRDLLNEGNSTEIQKWYLSAQENHQIWLEERNLASWTRMPGSENIPSSFNFIQNIFGFGKKRKEK